jgi:sec-independent protein translocase protein TatC
MPVLLSLLGRVGILTSRQLIKARRYAYVGIVIVAAIVTPPDAFSMISLIVPLIALYEISIWSVKFFESAHVKERV